MTTGQFVSLQRNLETGYKGSFYDGALLRDFELSREELLAYSYENDRRFQILIYEELSEALTATIAAPTFDQPSRPNINELLLVHELLKNSINQTDETWSQYRELRNSALEDLSCKKIAVSDAIQCIEELKPKQDDWERYRRTGSLSCLNNSRNILFKAFGIVDVDIDEVSKSLMDVVENRAFEDFDTVGIAIWALGRQNQKRTVIDLANLVPELDSKLQRLVDLALQFICSGRELVQLPHKPVDRVDFWAGLEVPSDTDAGAWLRLDAESVFWEKRLRAIKNAIWMSDLWQQLATDEVETIRTRVNQYAYSAGPPSLAATVTEQLEYALIKKAVSLVRDREDFNLQLYRIVQRLNVQSRKSESGDLCHTTCSEAASLIVFLANEVTGAGVSAFVWRTAFSVLENRGFELRYSKDVETRLAELAISKTNTQAAIIKLLRTNVTTLVSKN